MPSVPRKSEPLESLKARYPLALKGVYDFDSIGRGGARPGELPQHIFDHLDGLRLIISRTRLRGKLYLSISASFPEDCSLAADHRVLLAYGWPAEAVYAAWLRSIPRRFAALSGDERPLHCIGISDASVPHWAIEEESAACTP